MGKQMQRKIVILGLIASLLLTACTRKENQAQPDKSTTMNPNAPTRVRNAVRHVSSQLARIYLHIPLDLAITRPTEYLNTTSSTFFVTGTSDPKEPLLLNGEPVERLGDKGTFGVFVALEMAENFITVTQGDIKKEIIISRDEPTTTPQEPINYIPQDSMYPLLHGGTRVGKTLAVSCTAPADSLVLATLGSETIKLEQSGTADKGFPVLFQGSLPIEGSFVDDETKKVGPIAYTLTVDGKTERYESTGDVYVAGKDTNISFEINNYIGFVYPDTNDLSVFTEIAKEGATDYLMSQSNKYFELYSGGFIPTEMVQIIEGKDRVSNAISAITADAKPKGEIYEFSGTGKPIYDVRISDEFVELELFNSTMETDTFPPLLEKSIFTAAEVIPQEKSVLVRLTRKPGIPFWGYNIRFENDSVIFEVQHKPTLADSKYLPLKGITIAIDPGHGGDDKGANGLAGETGTQEADINLAHAFALQNELMRLGADVQLTRENNSAYSLDERLEMHESFQADLFISLHHNSIEITQNANEAKGMEAYYYTNFSAPVADAVMKGLEQTVSRTLRSVNQSYYRVTLLPYSPSILVELAFVSNPKEYEEATTLENLEATSKGIALGILEALA